MKVYLVQHVQFDAGWAIPQTYKVFKNKEKESQIEVDNYI